MRLCIFVSLFVVLFSSTAFAGPLMERSVKFEESTVNVPAVCSPAVCTPDSSTVMPEVCTPDGSGTKAVGVKAAPARRLLGRVVKVAVAPVKRVLSVLKNGVERRHARRVSRRAGRRG